MSKKNPVTEPMTANDGEAERHPKSFRFECMTFEQGKQRLVVFLASAKSIWSVVQVNQRTEDREGYQRAVSSSRASKIAAFIDQGNLIPNSVLISFDHAKLSGDGKTVIIENRQDAGWVIDGQHRLAGGVRSTKDITLPVVAFVDLPLTEQIKCFVTINREQKGVPSSLYLELLKQIPGSRTDADAAKERAVDLANLLKVDEESPFFNRIVSITSPKRGELSLTNFVRKIAPLLKIGIGRLNIYNDEERCGILNNYYKGLAQVFPKEFRNPDSVFFKTVGFGALVNALPTFLDITLQACGGQFKVADTAKVFSKIDYFDFGDWHRIGAGNAAEITAGEDLRTELMGALETAPDYPKIKL